VCCNPLFTFCEYNSDQMLTIYQHLAKIWTRHFWLTLWCLALLSFVWTEGLHSVYAVYILLYCYSCHNRTHLFWPLTRIKSFVTRIAFFRSENSSLSIATKCVLTRMNYQLLNKHLLHFVDLSVTLTVGGKVLANYHSNLP